MNNKPYRFEVGEKVIINKTHCNYPFHIPLARKLKATKYKTGHSVCFKYYYVGAEATIINKIEHSWGRIYLIKIKGTNNQHVISEEGLEKYLKGILKYGKDV